MTISMKRMTNDMNNKKYYTLPAEAIIFIIAVYVLAIKNPFGLNTFWDAIVSLLFGLAVVLIIRWLINPKIRWVYG